MNYRGSYRKLHANSRAAMLSAIEIYNKPQLQYRDEVFVILLLNAWELALKAIVSKGKQSIFERKEPGKPYRTVGWHEALRRTRTHGLWPGSIPLIAVEENLRMLATYRDQAVHFYNAKGFGIVVFGLAQTSITNYRDVCRLVFDDDLADSITWQLMPLGVEPPVEPMTYLRGDRPGRGSGTDAVDEFISALTQAAQRVEETKADTGRLMTIYDMKLQSIKKLDSADLVGIAGAGTADGEPTFVERKVDPRISHPLFPKVLVGEIGELHGKRFTQHDLTALERRYGWRDKPSLCYFDEDTNRVRWSREMVREIKRLSAGDLTEARQQYRDDLAQQRTLRRLAADGNPYAQLAESGQTKMQAKRRRPRRRSSS